MIPTQQEVLRPVLEVVAAGRPRLLGEVEQHVADRFDMDEEERARQLASGETVLANRVGWARTSLVKAGLLDQPGPTLIAITEEGQAFLQNHSGEITHRLLRDTFPSFARWLADMGQISDEEVPAPSGSTVWMLRAGRNGVYAAAFVELSCAVLGWGDTGDVSEMTQEQLQQVVKSSFPEFTPTRRGQAVSTLYRLVHTVADGDLIITPEPASRTLLLGWVDGPYRFLDAEVGPGYRHARPVRWFARVSRDDLSYGARNSLGSLMPLTRPSHASEMLALAEAHANDEPPAPMQPQASVHAPEVPARVPVPSASAFTSKRASLAEFQTNAMSMLPMLDQLENGQIALPDFQRSFVWLPDETRELIVSMIRSFPAGALLFLQDGGDTFKARAVEAAEDLKIRPSYLVLDGQQRLSSLYQALTGVGQSRFFLDVGALIKGSEVNDAVRVLPAEKASVLETRAAQADALLMPLAVIRSGGMARWRDEVVALRDEEDRERLRDLLYKVEEAYIAPLVGYRFPVTVLPGGTPLEAVCTIFETLNRTGRPLTPFELISARAFAGGLSLFDLWQTAREQHPILEDFQIEPYYLLQVIALQLGRSPKRGSVLSLSAEEVAAQWNSVTAEMAGALTLLRDQCGVLVSKWLPYRPMLIPLASAWRKLSEATGPDQGAMRTKLAQWFWCQCFTGEYESSSLTLAERDAPDLKDWLSGGEAPPAVADFQWDPERWRTVTSRQQGLYKATIALSLTNQPRDFHTAAPLTRQVIETGKVDDHHVFPRAYLKDIGRDGEVDSVLNHTLIDRATNGSIGKKAPSVYLAEIRKSLGAELDAVLMSHRLPPGEQSSLTADDFDGFLSWRIHQLKEALTARVGEFAAPAHAISPHLATLNESIEDIELAIRELIVVRLENDPNQLASHIQQKALERAHGDAKREPGSVPIGKLDLEAVIQYLDMRELQDVVTSKATWTLFADVFQSKEVVANRFGQLAVLRNAIRHSRTMSAVTVKDGEAALLWFEQTLDALEPAGTLGLTRP